MKPVKTERTFTGKWLVSLLVLIVVAVAFAIHAGIAKRVTAETKLREQTHEAAVQSVVVQNPKLTTGSEELVLPGNIQAFTDAPIYARTNGYLKHWYADIGTHVKAGQLLADIETPELDSQLQQAKADLGTAQANLTLSNETAERYQNLIQKGAVSKQETDEKVGDLNARKAMLASAESNVKRLQDLQSFEKIYAPFDGVITVRNTDVGALIDSGSNAAAGKELFHLAATGRLRVFVNVPEVDERAALSGMKAVLTLAEFPGRSFTATIARNAGSIDPASRTLLVEVDVENPTGEILPGAYVSVHLKIPKSATSTVTIPVSAMLFRAEGLRVATLRNGHAELIPITTGRDYGNEIEVLSGLKASDKVIVNPPDSVVSGTPVRVANAGD